MPRQTSACCRVAPLLKSLSTRRDLAKVGLITNQEQTEASKWSGLPQSHTVELKWEPGSFSESLPGSYSPFIICCCGSPAWCSLQLMHGESLTFASEHTEGCPSHWPLVGHLGWPHGMHVMTSQGGRGCVPWTLAMRHIESSLFFFLKNLISV